MQANKDTQEDDQMYVWEHRHTKGITAEIINRTNKGFKVKQTEEYEAWGDNKLKKPKTKTAFYGDEEFIELFKIKGFLYFMIKNKMFFVL
jgi:hypothetical protein